MSLIRIRGRTILAPILSEEERVEARALRDQAVQFQHERQRLQKQQAPRCTNCHHQLNNHHNTWVCDSCSSSRDHPSSGSEKVLSGCRTHGSTLASPSMTQSRQREGPPETSSSSGPSSHGSGEPMSEGPEDSPSAANVSVQTDSSVSLTASTDLRSYLNTSLDNSLDTSISASHDTWHQSSSLAEVDEALLLSASPEVATSLILGRLHPSAVLHPSTTVVRSSQADSQHTETASSTLMQVQRVSEHLATSENHDTTTTASLSLSFASVSEEGGEGSGDGLDVSEEILEVSEEAIYVSEDDRAGSSPREVVSDTHKDDHEGHSSHRRPSKSCKTNTDVGKTVRDAGTRETTNTGVKEIRDGSVRDKRDPSWMLQWDSGRSSSHSDYLDDYLELLTSRCNSGLGLESNVLSVATCKGPSPVTTSTATSKVTSTSGSETSNSGNFSTASGVNVAGKQKEKKCEKSEGGHEKEVCQGKEGGKTDTKEHIKEKRSPRELQRTREALAEPRSMSAASERRVSRRSRARRWSSAQPLDPGRSVGSKYLDSYLGNLTDDAWLQYPTRLTSRHMVFLDSDDYMHSVRPQTKKTQEEGSDSRNRSESSTSEETREPDTSITSSDDPLSNINDENSSSDLSINPSVKDRKAVTSKQHIVKESQSAEAQGMTWSQNLDLDNKKIASHSLPNESYQDQEATMDMSLGSQVLQENGLHEAPETPSDKTENKVSSDEGIEVLGSPLSTGSDGKRDDGIGSKTFIKEIKQIQVIPPTPSESEKFISDENRSEVESTVSALKVEEVSGCAERSEECQDSSSEDSSETEPSTIVYVDDCPTDSLSEGQKNSLVDSEVRNKTQVDTKEQISSLTDSKEQSSLQEDDIEASSCDIQGKERKVSGSETVLVPKKVASPRKDNEKTSEIVEHQLSSSVVQLVTVSEHTEEIGERGTRKTLVTCTQRLDDNSQDKDKVLEYDMYDSDDECLVVQVYEDKNIISQGETGSEVAKWERKESTESDQVEQVVKIVPQRKDRLKYNRDSSCDVDLVPYKGSEDAMDQVLTLLRAKQQQELEELRLRQEEEVREFIRQLQCVSPEQLQAFLLASSGKSADGNVGDACSYQMPQNILKTKTLRSDIENDEVKGGNRQQGPKISIASYKEASVPDESDDKVVLNSQISIASVDSVEVVSPTIPGQAREWGSQSGSSPTATHPLVTQSCSSSHQSVSHIPMQTFTSSTTPPPTANEKTRVESPKPRPSNHTNLMPSYIMNEEARKSSGHQENENYIQHDLSYQNISPKKFIPHMSCGPHHIPHSGTSVSDSDSSNVAYSLARNNNSNLESVDSVSFINGNCVNYGDGMQYYRLCTPDEDLTIDDITPKITVVESSYQSQPTETVTQPGLFKVLSNGPWCAPRPTSITSLLAEHPEIFREDIVEVNLGDWPPSSVGLGESCRNVVDECSMSREAAAIAEGGLDMVPERECATNVHFHRLSRNVIFVRGITRLQACVRRYMTQRLLRTKFVQEQLATLAEIAKLAQQFHRDILTDNIHRGDVDFHKALYNQEGMARERIRKVFFVLGIQEQMSLIRRDRQLWQMEQAKQSSTNYRSSPTHTSSSKYKSRNVEERPRSTMATKLPAAKRPSPTGQKPQQDVKTRTGSLRGRTPRLVQPSVTHHPSPSHTVHMSGVHADHKHSPRVSKLPVQMERSSLHIESVPSHYNKSSLHVKSPQETRYGLIPSSRCASHPRSSSASQLPSRTGSRQSSRTSSHVPSVTRSMSCTARSATHTNSPRKAVKMGHAPPLAFTPLQFGIRRVNTSLVSWCGSAQHALHCETITSFYTQYTL
ncbi:hypothetical protein OTU49_007673 [Cherax quadricarinatus]|uniref:Uncharacterized protein n=1 Tax=Cherax quadricarinatus TaxID=27406 RepID=A0AAW0WFQ9_CHEQU